MSDSEHSLQPPQGSPATGGGVARFIGDYLWLIAKNVIGWVLVLSSFVIGPALPGPGGIPLFLIGFALVSFPGKRRLTARVLRGKPFRLGTRPVVMATMVIAVTVPALLVRIWRMPLPLLPQPQGQSAGAAIGIYALDVVAVWALIYLALLAGNLLLRWAPRMRRRVRPWMRRHGVRLLPPRYHRRVSLRQERRPRLSPNEILEIHERHHERMRALVRTMKPWIRRAIGLAIVTAVFFWIFKPVVRQWPEVSERLMATSPARFFLAAAMFSVFLFVFRATSWRWILRGLGKKMLLAPVTRIWCASELARYLPGVIWQVVGRVYLSRPYGISAGLSSVSQVLELVIFLLSNILVAITCLLWFGTKMAPEARPYLYGVMAMVPVLLVVVHPRIFYPMMNRILRWFHKPPILQRLSGKMLIGLVLWAILGLLWQSLAVWVLTEPLLGLKLAKWWVVAGAYCLAWSVGFTFGSVTPGGIGVREFVFVHTMHFILPPAVRAGFGDHASLDTFLKFLSVLLRLWATTGELTLASLAHLADIRGALGRADAPGRVPLQEDVARTAVAQQGQAGQ